MFAARYSVIALLSAILLLPVTIHAQVSFFTPPAYSGGGNGNPFAADFNRDGKLDLLSPDGTLQLGKGNGTFTTGTPVNGTPLAVADFNGDGKPDILEQTAGTLVVLLGNGDGTFQAPLSTHSSTVLAPIVTADLRGNGIIDVVGIFNNTLLVFLGKGDGTFVIPGAEYPNLQPGATIIIGDFNGDEKADVAVTSSQTMVFFGNGDGTLQTPPVITPNGLYPAVSGDFNGDGKLDLGGGGSAVSGGPAFVVLLGNGDGTFQPPMTGVPLVFSPGSFATADLNGDGKLDVLMYLYPFLEVHVGNGDGTFSQTPSYLTNLGASTGLAVGDFNLDGKVDVAAGNYMLLGNGNGTLQGQPATPLRNPVRALTFGDFDKNGTQDVAVIYWDPSEKIDIYLNDGSGVLTFKDTYSALAANVSVVAADLNGDGNLDLVVVGSDPSSGNWSYSVLLGNGDGSFQGPFDYPQNVVSGCGSCTIVINDFNNDHKPDLAIGLGNPLSQSMALLLGNGDGTFSAPAYFFDGGTGYFLAADFNGDGNLDIAASNATPQTALLFGNGDGTFQPASFALGAYEAVFTADFNNDGKADLLGGNSHGDQTLLGNGDGTFKLVPSGSIVDLSRAALGDINGDGALDLVGVSDSNSELGISLGKGDGTFGPFLGVIPWSNYLFDDTFVRVVDMNGDGKPDLVIYESRAQNGESGLFVLPNTTSKTTGNLGLLVPPGGSNTQTVQAGSMATYNLSIGGMGWSGPVTLSCAGAPTGATCSFPGGASMNVSGGSASQFSVTVSTTAPSMAAVSPISHVDSAWLWAMGLVGFVILPASLKVKQARLGAGMMTIFLMLLCSCGGGSGNGGGGSGGGTSGGTPAGTYQLTVTATSGSIKASLPLKLIVQ